MRITVIKLRNIIKIVFIFFIMLILLIILINSKSKVNHEKKSKNEISLVECLKIELPIIDSFDKKDLNQRTSSNIGLKILSMQAGIFNNVVENENVIPEDKGEEKEIINDTDEQTKKIEEIVENSEEKNEEPIIKSKEIKVVDENNIKASYTNEFNGIKINNQTSYDISGIIESSSYEFNSKKVIIYHTHTCESYTPTEQFNYNMTDSYRTTDINYSVVRVGNELENELKKYNFNIIHSNTYHDYPSYNGSYGRSLNTLQNIFKENKDAQIIIDLHRDAIGNMNNYAPRVQIGEKTCAQVMFVIGTDGSGLNHPNWRENLKYAIEVQKKANELYPGLFRPIILRNSRFNQQLTTASSIIEVGATGNTLEECLESMKYVAEIFNSLF